MSSIKKMRMFLSEIGISSKIVAGSAGFLPGVQIENGTLLIAPNAAVADVLHEAGHLAVLPSRFREFANDDISAVTEKMLNETDFSDPDAPEARAAMQSSETEATAWAWAAGKHIGISEKKIILDHHYENGGTALRAMLEAKMYLGINGLRAAGMIASVKSYPKMERWVQA